MPDYRCEGKEVVIEFDGSAGGMWGITVPVKGQERMTAFEARKKLEAFKRAIEAAERAQRPLPRKIGDY